MGILYTFIAISVEFTIGVFFGILTKNDKNQKKSYQEIKLASILFAITVMTWHITSPLSGIESLFNLSYLWIALISGVLIGQLISARFLGRIGFILKKKDVQLAISEFENMASYVAISNDNRYNERMDRKLMEIYKLIETLKLYDTKEQEHWEKHLDEIAELCSYYSGLSRSIGQKKSSDHDEENGLIDKLSETGQELSDIVFHTLNHSQQDLSSLGIIFKRGGFNANKTRDKKTDTPTNRSSRSTGGK